MATKRVVILGEYHGAAPIIQLQASIQETLAKSIVHPIPMATSATTMAASASIVPHDKESMKKCPHSPDNDEDDLASIVQNMHSSPKVRVIMEHFSMEMQQLLDAYQSGMIDAAGLLEGYKEIGTEGHNLQPYLPVFSSALLNNRIHLYGGFIPRPYARMIMKEGLDSTLQRASSKGFISSEENLQGTDAHYNFFESLLTGRDLHSDPLGKLATDRFRAKMFPAQIIKDASMAWCAKNINDILNKTGEDRMLLVCGVGHMLYNHGVPERVHAHKILEKKEDMLRVACLPMTAENIRDEENDCLDTEALLKVAYGSPDHGGLDSNAADICFLYRDDEEEEIDEKNTDDDIRQETKDAYDKVGSTAHLEGGDMRKAHAILKSLNYNSDEIAFAGADAVNYQGVGCPHRHIDIQEGNSVLDMGSGLGVDSLIATGKVGATGRVVGVDLSSECVNHANKRARERGVDNVVTFVQSSIESIGDKVSMPGADNNQVHGQSIGFDIIMSNGAFCLLPNKKAGFSECYRLLKSGGRIAICTTVIKDQLEDGVEWPLCMQTFAKMNELEPMLKELGFEDIVLDLSDSLMEVPEPEMEDDEEHEESHDDKKNSVDSSIQDKSIPSNDEPNEGRYKVHNEQGREEFRHLENFDMNALCARVVIKARKP